MKMVFGSYDETTIVHAIRGGSVSIVKYLMKKGCELIITKDLCDDTYNDILNEREEMLFFFVKK